jgi:hypothetical protein
MRWPARIRLRAPIALAWAPKRSRRASKRRRRRRGAPRAAREGPASCADQRAGGLTTLAREPGRQPPGVTSVQRDTHFSLVPIKLIKRLNNTRFELNQTSGNGLHFSGEGASKGAHRLVNRSLVVKYNYG